MTIKAVFFDMDGVLIDAKDWHYEALNQALRLFGMEISRQEHLQKFDGLPTKVKLKTLSNERGLPQGLHSFINSIKQQYTMDIVHQKCKPTFRHERALSILKSMDFKLAVCSNSIRNSVEVMMDKSNLSSYLDLMISTDDVNRTKPDPEMYLKAVEIFQLQPEECLILEDNENGIQAAKASGCHLLKIEEVTDVSFENIFSKINEINGVKI
jgi:HAD superfamily hydrolase (TIGR01509 family)